MAASFILPSYAFREKSYILYVTTFEAIFSGNHPVLSGFPGSVGVGILSIIAVMRLHKTTTPTTTSQVDSWRRMVSFFKEKLGGQNKSEEREEGNQKAKL